MDNTHIMQEKSYLLNDFDYSLPDDLIAQVPEAERSSARLLIRDKEGIVSHSFVHNLGEYLPKGALIICNSSKVIPSRMFAHIRESGSGVEFLFLYPPQGSPYAKVRALGKPIKKMRVGSTIVFADAAFTAEVSAIPYDVLNEGIELTFTASSEEIVAYLELNGFAPLPPYIKRDRFDERRKSDLSRYQTVFAKELGSIAAPTAGLHFTDEIIQALKVKGIDFADIILHVGMGTFKPVTHADITQHTMHKERFLIPKETLDKIFTAIDQNKPIIGVGTTSLRSLESFFILGGEDRANLRNMTDHWLETDIFIYPREFLKYKPWCLSALMTNFHQPKSTLFMLIAALIGLDDAQKLYHIAMQERYRFFSYGDSSLLWLK